ncbi:MAG: riboflavin synthase [Rhodospirillales bacterium]
MFTGIITDLGRVRKVGTGADRRLEITTAHDTAGLDVGASVCCSGACLTVIDKGDDRFAVTVSAETLARTTLGDWSEGTAVNLERALALGDELGGHLVAGHVDGIAVLVDERAEGSSRRLVFEAPEDLSPMIAAKGSVALDGVSLTVNEVDGGRFGVNAIPHTLKSTTLGGLRPGDRVNLEIDILARYVARLLERD